MNFRFVKKISIKKLFVKIYARLYKRICASLIVIDLQNTNIYTCINIFFTEMLTLNYISQQLKICYRLRYKYVTWNSLIILRYNYVFEKEKQKIK